MAICLAHFAGPPSSGSLGEAMGLWRLGPFRKHRDFPVRNYLEIFEMLLVAGADPNQPLRFGYRILHDVVTTGVMWGESVMSETVRCRFAELLIDHGAELDVVDDLLQATPLGWAVRWGKTRLAKLLLDRGADLNLAGAPWATPLAWAEKKNRRTLAKLLADRGARP